MLKVAVQKTVKYPSVGPRYIHRLDTRMQRILVSLLFALGTCAAGAQALQLRDGWVRGIVRGQSVTSAYLVVDSTSAALIVGARSPLAERVELRKMEMSDSGPLRSRTTENFAVTAGETLRLTPLTEHLMLVGLKRPISAGEQVPITLEYLLSGEKRGEVSIEAIVRPFYGQR